MSPTSPHSGSTHEADGPLFELVAGVTADGTERLVYSCVAKPAATSAVVVVVVGGRDDD